MDHWPAIFTANPGVGVMLQAGILLAMYLGMRQTGARIEAIADEVKIKLLPAVDHAEAFLTEIRPKLHIIADNLQASTVVLRSQVERVDATVNDTVDRARLQIIRADELLGRTLDRVEQTSDMVHQTVISPVRQISGIMHGITVGLEFLFGGRARKNGAGRDASRPVPPDEMFL